MAKKQESLAGIGGVRGIIQNLQTTEIFETEFHNATSTDLQLVNQQEGWSFNWLDFVDAFYIVKVTTTNNQNIVQGLVAFSMEKNHIFMDFVEVAPHNKGKGKVYNNVAGNLMAFMCYTAMKKTNGIVVFEPKPQLASYYKANYYADWLPNNNKKMYFSEPNLLINKYLNT